MKERQECGFQVSTANFDRHHSLGVATYQAKEYEKAVAYFLAALVIRPDSAAAYSNFGAALKALNQANAAVAVYSRAIAIRPEFAGAHFNRGNSLKELSRLDHAIVEYEAVICIDPGFAGAYNNRGVALKEVGRLAAAISAFNRVIAIEPSHVEAHYSRAIALLLGGDLRDGWELYEWRWKRNIIAGLRRDFHQPLWLGKEPLDGKILLIESEQGLGDTIQFCRYARMASDLGATVILEVLEPLLNLLQGLSGVSNIIVKGSPLPPYDYHCPLMSLPMVFKTDLDSIPHAQKYLTADADKLRRWTRKLGEKTKPRIGLAWSSISGFPDNKSRSVPLSEFLEALPESGFEYICLQKEICASDATTLKSRPDIRWFGEEFNDLSDTAALIETLDLVVSTCTSIPHLSAALGKPTWILLAYIPDWRWLLDRDDTPWYPSVRLFRQEKIGDWQTVFISVRTSLTRHFSIPSGHS